MKFLIALSLLICVIGSWGLPSTYLKLYLNSAATCEGTPLTIGFEDELVLTLDKNSKLIPCMVYITRDTVGPCDGLCYKIRPHSYINGNTTIVISNRISETSLKHDTVIPAETICSNTLELFVDVNPRGDSMPKEGQNPSSRVVIDVFHQCMLVAQAAKLVGDNSTETASNSTETASNSTDTESEDNSTVTATNTTDATNANTTDGVTGGGIDFNEAVKHNDGFQHGDAFKEKEHTTFVTGIMTAFGLAVFIFLVFTANLIRYKMGVCLHICPNATRPDFKPNPKPAEPVHVSYTPASHSQASTRSSNDDSSDSSVHPYSSRESEV